MTDLEKEIEEMMEWPNLLRLTRENMKAVSQEAMARMGYDFYSDKERLALQQLCHDLLIAQVSLAWFMGLNKRSLSYVVAEGRVTTI